MEKAQRERLYEDWRELGRTRVMQPQAKECQEPPEARRGKKGLGTAAHACNPSAL